MDACFRSLAVAVLLSGTQICAAEIPAPNQKVIIVEREGKEVAATTDDKSGATAKESKEQPAEIFFLTTEPASATRYWIGLEANPLGKPGRARLKVDADFGLLIEHVRPASPADKAGLKANDVLLKAGDKPLRQTSDLAAAIQQSKGSDLKLDIERDGKLQNIVVKPIERRVAEGEGQESEPGLRIRLAEPADATRQGATTTEDELRQAHAGLQSALLKARQMEAQRAGQDTVRQRTKALLAERRAMQQQLHALNEKLAALGADAETGSAEKIRGQLHEVEQRIEALNRQLVGLEASQMNPEQEKLMTQLSTMLRCAADLEEVGRTEESNRLKSTARELEQRLQAEKAKAAQTPNGLPLTYGLPGIVPPGNKKWIISTYPQPDPEQVRLMQLKAAVQLLEQAGMREDAKRLQQKLEAAQHELQQRREKLAERGATSQSNPEVAELRQQIAEMHRELHELHEAVERLSQSKH